VCAVSLLASVSAKASESAGYGEDLYGDSEETNNYEAPKPYEAPKEAAAYEPQHYEAPKAAAYEPQHYEAPKAAAYEPQNYEAPKAAAYEPPAENYEEKSPYPIDPAVDEKVDEYEGVEYEAPEEMEYMPDAVDQKLYLEPCQNDHECGQGICDTDHKCRCMDFWWTPDPKPTNHRRRLGDSRALQYQAQASYEIKTQPCSMKRKSQAEAFLLQLFLGPLGMGCFYLGWNGYGAASLILGMFPFFFFIFVCFCATACVCCVAPLVWCTEKICCCCFPKEDEDHHDKPDDIKEVERRRRCQSCCGLIISITYLIVWIVSLFQIANHCNTDGGIPCVPW